MKRGERLGWATTFWVVLAGLLAGVAVAASSPVGAVTLGG